MYFVCWRQIFMFVRRTIFIKKKFSCWSYKGSSENNRQDLNFYIPGPDVAQLGSNVCVTLWSSAYSHISTCGCCILQVWYEFYPWDTVCFYPMFVCLCMCVCCTGFAHFHFRLLKKQLGTRREANEWIKWIV